MAAQVEKGELIGELRAFDEERRKLGPQLFIHIFDLPDGKADIFDLAVSDFVLPPTGQPQWSRRADAAEAMAASRSAAKRLASICKSCIWCCLSMAKRLDVLSSVCATWLESLRTAAK